MDEAIRWQCFNPWGLALTWLRPDTGRLGEDLATRLLRKAGCSILSRNWRCKCGEIDIVAADYDTLVFVEVKSRLLGVSRDYSPCDAVDAEKERHMRTAADRYMSIDIRASRRRRLRKFRFDLITVVFDSWVARLALYKGVFRHTTP